MTNYNTQTLTNREREREAVRQGRSELDCSNREFHVWRGLYESVFGPEAKDYSLK
jgi:hypothetical protein